MAARNFIPELVAEKMLQELQKEEVLIAHCTKEYSGQIEKQGSVVTILSVKRPTIGDYVEGVTEITPEEIQDESRKLEITEAKYFAFKVDRIAMKQSGMKAFNEALRLASIGFKDEAEQFVAGKYVEAGENVVKTGVTSENILSTLLAAKVKLLRNNVSTSEEIFLEVTPEVYQKLVLAKIVYTESEEALKQGAYSPILGMRVYLSNNLVSDSDTQHHCMMRTKAAIGYAEQIIDVKKYEPEKSFGKAVKGLHVYGAKVISPEQLVHLDITITDETVI